MGVFIILSVRIYGVVCMKSCSRRAVPRLRARDFLIWGGANRNGVYAQISVNLRSLGNGSVGDYLRIAISPFPCRSSLVQTL